MSVSVLMAVGVFHTCLCDSSAFAACFPVAPWFGSNCSTLAFDMNSSDAFPCDLIRRALSIAALPKEHAHTISLHKHCDSGVS